MSMWLDNFSQQILRIPAHDVSIPGINRIDLRFLIKGLIRLGVSSKTLTIHKVAEDMHQTVSRSSTNTSALVGKNTVLEKFNMKTTYETFNGNPAGNPRDTYVRTRRPPSDLILSVPTARCPGTMHQNSWQCHSFLMSSPRAYVQHIRKKAHSLWLAVCCGYVLTDFTHILQDYFYGIGAIIRLPNEVTLMNMENSSLGSII